MSPSGGKREGAGKPALYGKAMKRINVMLDPETIAFYTEYGEGNLSEGIRKYWRSLTKHAPDARESGAKIVSSKSKRSVKSARG